jgi:hypothetical protein
MRVKVLANAVERGKGIAIVEMARREQKIMVAICFITFLILFLTLEVGDAARWILSGYPASRLNLRSSAQALAFV